MSRILGKPLYLYGVDIEALCQWVIKNSAFRTLNHSDREELLMFLIETAWEESEKFDPDRDEAKYGKKPSFSNYLTQRLSLRCVDWSRGWFKGDKRYNRPAPMFEPLVLEHGEESWENPEIQNLSYRANGTVVDHLIAEEISFHGALSETGKILLDTVAKPLAEGYSRDEVGKKTGLGRAGVNRAIEQLQHELADYL